MKISVTIKSCRIWKVGSSYVITVPKIFISNDVFNLSSKYRVKLIPTND